MNKLLVILSILFLCSCSRAKKIEVFYGKGDKETIVMHGFSPNTEYYMMDNMLMAKTKKCDGTFKYKIAHDLKIKSFKIIDITVEKEEPTIQRSSKPDRGF